MANRPSITEQFDPEQIYQIIEEYLSIVGRRQYVGARYVPIFGRVGEDSIEWDNTAPYEPLTIVLYQGNSYTSRQYVPTGVDIDNEEFWACTGNYNAQVEAYRREVLDISDAIDANNLRVTAVEESLPIDDFEDETVKEYIDKESSEVPGTFQAKPKDIEHIATLESLGVIQGLHFDGTYYYYATYSSTDAPTRIIKLNSSFEEVGRIELSEYAHANCLSEYQGNLLITGASKLKRVVLSTFTEGDDIDLQNTLDDFVVFENGTYAFAYRNTSTPPAIYGLTHNVFVPIGVFDYETQLSGRQDACSCYSNVAHLMGNVQDASNGNVTNQIVFVRRNGAISYRIVLPTFENELQGLTFDATTNTFYILDVEGELYKLAMPAWFNSSLTNLALDNVWMMYRNLQYSCMIGSYDEQPNLYERVVVDNANVDIVRYFNHRFPYMRNAQNAYILVNNQWHPAQFGTSTSGYDTIRAAITVYWASRGIYILRMNYDRGSSHDLYLSSLAITKITQDGVYNASAISFSESETSESFAQKVVTYVTDSNLTGNPLLSTGTYGLCCLGRPLPDVYNTFIDLD